MQTLVKGYFRLLEVLLVACLAVMVVLVFGNVVLRYVFNSGLEVAEELSRLLFLISTFLGAIVALRERLHLGVDTVVRRLGPGGRRVCLAVCQVGMLAATFMLLIGSVDQARINLHTVMPVTGVSMAVFYGLGVVFGVSAGVMLLRDLYRTVTGRLDVHETVIVRASEEAGDVLAKPEAAPAGATGKWAGAES